MAIRVALKHNTEYQFDKLVSLSPHVIRLRPAPHSRTPIHSYSLNVEPKKHFINWQQDPFGNYLARFVFPEKTKSLKIHVEVIAEMTVINPFDFFLDDEASNFPFKYDEQLAEDLVPYLELTDNGPKLKEWLAEVDRSEKPTINFLVELNQRLQKDISYLIRMEPGVQTCEETLGKRIGSCRDTAWLLVQILRHLGLAARFVSGYLVQLTSDIKSLDGPSGPEKDFTDLHAWTEVFLPGAGWVGLDPTSGMFVSEGHIPLACTPDPISAAPITGATDPCEVEFVHSNEVIRIHEDPRVTKPYTDAQWKSILALGKKTDRDLKKDDVRLTIGGEPTFVSIDDMEGAEWNDAALGDKKRELAGKLILRLKEKFAPGGMLHYGQGKWYPGEPLPRWSLSLFWRKDGKPIWNDTQWLADETKKYDLEDKDAAKFINTLADKLNVSQQYVIPGYEDTGYYLWKENKLPEGVDPENNKLKDPLERARLQKLFAKGLNKVTGYTLPLKFKEEKKGKGFWKSSVWPFRSEHMLLTPGDSPMGYRLPLESLPWTLPDDVDITPERDPFEERDALPDGSKTSKKKASKKKADKSEREVVHTALCVELRDGRLNVFMPPIPLIEHYLEVVSVVEETAKDLKLPVVLEGYTPAWDSRIQMLQVTPDPGVIEVNIHPANDWKELVNNTESIYQEARLTRLGTEKFMLDGKHSGTGGGNHITLGGATPADSPFLRRPDLLRSLITYWQHHPSLSYLFSGMFIGPTSQAPRIDEARDDNLYELEIALSELPDGESDKPWLVDRVLRNFLIDLTGNTHRAEFCIDKLYSPDSASGRKGLVEFRGFEMPPHERMSLLQLLLVRSLVARFWNEPYKKPMIRWGTELHDRFMLPHYIWEDFKQVIDDQREAGYKFEMEWFGPFREFRFPHIGTLFASSMQLDLHSALEPWHVLGEESSGQGTARYVDSSVERLQVSVNGMAGDRYIVTCNGRKVPLRPTGVRGSYVAGVRYKAWDPHSALHPTIKTHTPLVFDIVDTANQHSIAGCTYHVSHPGGRSYETFPVNASEAESRRSNRFLPHGHTQGKIEVSQETPPQDQPYSLDLRRPANI
jgi:uncharacterized protein (DUF2126 family)/transglutaminase-like putative cysteine protease